MISSTDLPSHSVPGDQLVAIVDIGLVVNVVVILQRFGAHAQIGQRVMRVGKVGK